MENKTLKHVISAAFVVSSFILAFQHLEAQAVPSSMTVCEDNACDGGNGAKLWFFGGRDEGEERYDGQKRAVWVQSLGPNNVSIRRQDTPSAPIGPGPYTVFTGHLLGTALSGTLVRHVDGHVASTGKWMGSTLPTTCDSRTTIPAAKVAGAAAASLKQGTAALDCYLIAARQGDSDAQTFAGLLLHSGIGVTHDQAEAFNWLSKAAKANNVRAERNLADMYRQGMGTAKNSAMADSLVARANQQERAQSQAETKAFMSMMNEVAPVLAGALDATPSGLVGADGVTPTERTDGGEVTARHPQPQRLAPEVARCDQANPENVKAEEALRRGKLADDAQVDKTAICWFRISAQQGNARANVYLSNAYITGWGVPENDKTAFEYMKKAAEMGDLYGEAYLAEFYRNEIGNPGDWEQAKAWRDKVIKSPGGLSVWMDVRGTQLSDLQVEKMVSQMSFEQRIEECMLIRPDKTHWTKQQCIDYLK